MKSDKLFDAIGEAKSEYVQDAEAKPAAKRYGWVKWAAAAACVLIAVLIAVPALSGKAPEVESEPVEPVPVDMPADEPVNEPADEPEREAGAGALTREEFEGDLSSYSNTSGFSFEELNDPGYTYGDYLADYAGVTENPVFDALLNDGGVERFFASRVSAFLQIPEAHIQEATVFIDGISTFDWGRFVYLYHNDDYSDYDWLVFEQAAEQGVRDDYEINGVEVQKFYFLENYDARILIDGDWYNVYGPDESGVDETLAALADIAKRL